MQYAGTWCGGPVCHFHEDTNEIYYDYLSCKGGRIIANYQLSFGLQYEAWMLEIRIPDWLEFSSKGQALKYAGLAGVFF